VILVSSGAVGVGKQLLGRQAALKRTVHEMLQPSSSNSNNIHLMEGTDSKTAQLSFNSACAAAGQLGLMSLYETLFGQFNITIAQVNYFLL
jgi:delta-1-pyrroline-5-carboxylate synthetase